MPNVHRFLSRAAWYPNAMDYLPAATDMNHLNAVAGTSSGQTGMISVTGQLGGFAADGTPDLWQTSLDWTRDNLGHGIGAAHDLDERVYLDRPHRSWRPRPDDPMYHLAVQANSSLDVEPLMDAIRDVDHEFGRIMDNFEAMDVFDDSGVMLFSDHGMTSHNRGPALQYENLMAATDYYAVLQRGGLCTQESAVALGACCLGMMYWRGGKDTVKEARALLETQRVYNPNTGLVECPWWMLDRDDMKCGKPGVTLPGELYHEWFVETDAERTMPWPDLFLFARSHWELPVYGSLGNLGLALPDRWLGPLYGFMGSHGSIDTQPIVMAVMAPGCGARIIERPARIGDLAVTASRLFNTPLLSTTIGRDLSLDLV